MYRYNHKKGFIEWQVGTGGNHEITQIKAYEQGKGCGKEIFKGYLKRAKLDPPFHSTYAFVLGSREYARKFYKSVGFKEIVLGDSIYKDDLTILMWRPYESTHIDKQRNR